MNAWDAFGDDAGTRGEETVGFGRGRARERARIFCRRAARVRTTGDVDRGRGNDGGDRERLRGSSRAHGEGVGRGAAARCAGGGGGGRGGGGGGCRRRARGGGAGEMCAGCVCGAISDWKLAVYGVFRGARAGVGRGTVCGVSSSEEADAKTEAENDPTASAALRGERWSSSERLGRVALELLNACMLFESEHAPLWCANAVRLAEREISAATASETRALGHAAIPTSLPERGVPVVAEGRAMIVEQASVLTPPRFYTDYVSKETPVVIENLLGKG